MQLQLCLGLCVVFLCLCSGGYGQIVSRATWTRLPTHRLPRLYAPARYIIFHHTVTPPCYNPGQCLAILRSIQANHRSRRFRDIGYNFLIGGDGRIYEGLGFGIRGEHAPKYNSMSIGVAFIGNYHVTLPPGQMLQAARTLISIAQQRRAVQPNFVLLGHCQTKSTVCPGRRLLDEISKWPRWQRHP
ncbi:peptidoglycan-recognition protein SB2 [Scaptodrosophila lebanonensis]|uniref:Peptidoglycan-recognition protein n=1 Tax=Drosophila lebanonensis TaxID=7225 RepID=A0A6J2UFU6_DROLE|nr:peptidoglycan-recognition protein SB2 [Scaptodrosophila lebanonensis]